MELTGKAKFIRAQSGTKKDGTPWYGLKFLDDDQDEFFMAFTEERMFTKCEGLAKSTPVELTISLVPGRKYFTLLHLESLS